ncbi:MAG TPA: VanW family protein [Pyrinomonadaceae bacterium]|nr:VanW family protein [Pyrinomonadaceae bacterium]
MTTNPETLINRTPTYADAAIFRGKTLLLQLRRAVVDMTGPRVGRHSVGKSLKDEQVIATSTTRLWTENEPQERFLVAGKIHNLRIAIKRLDGIEVPANAIFSFWKHIGRASRLKGFVAGRELREGCIIPNVGGGLCQLSNALYDAALQANFDIIERHAHTQVIAGSLAEKGRDATVFWNYVDLRFRSTNAFRVEAKLTTDELVIRFRGLRGDASSRKEISIPIATAEARSCATCEVGDCHRVVDSDKHAGFGRTAFLVDEYSSEFDRHIQTNRESNDRLLIPLDGRRFRKENYAWTTRGFSAVRQSLAVTARRSYTSRKLAQQGAARQLNLLRMYEQLADSYARHLTYDVTHVVVQQNLLPFLWKKGHLGGRTFDVLMSSLPMHEIQKRLDTAFALHPESKTLGDFRADPELLASERDALRAARRVITPHSGIASLFPNRGIRIEWQMPAVRSREAVQNAKPIVVFPASTVGRKGCYELRDVLRGRDVKLICLGPMIEGADFWNGYDMERGTPNWLEIADLVVLPAFVEHRPTRLLMAASARVPVIATHDCGVDGVDGIVSLPAGDIDALQRAVDAALSR